MKRITVLFVCLAFAAGQGFAQQTTFSNTIQDFRPAVIDFREDGLLGCFRDGVLVNPSPADLKAGDVFIDVDGNARKVARVVREGNDWYVDTVRARFEEVFVYAEIPTQVLVFNGENFAPQSIAGSRSVSAAAVPPGGPLGLSWTIPTLEKEIYKSGTEDSPTFALVKLAFGGSLNSTITLGFRAPSLTLTSWKFWKASSWRQNYGYVSGRFDYDLAIGATLTLALAGKKETKGVPLYGFTVPAPGLEATLGLMTKTIFEGSLNFTAPLSVGVKGYAQAQCTLAGTFPVMWPTDFTKSSSLTYYVSLDPSLNADVSLKQKIYLGADVKLVGIKITKFEAGGGPYAKVNGNITGHVGFDSTDGLTYDLTASASGEIGLFLEINGEVWDGKWALTLLGLEYPFISFSTEDGITSPFFSTGGPAEPVRNTNWLAPAKQRGAL